MTMDATAVASPAAVECVDTAASTKNTSSNEASLKPILNELGGEPQEELTVMTLPLSLASLSPDHPLYIQHSSSSDHDDSSIPTMDHPSTQTQVVTTTPFLGATTDAGVLRNRRPSSTTSSLSRDDSDVDSSEERVVTYETCGPNQAQPLHHRKPSVVADLPPRGFFQSAHFVVPPQEETSLEYPPHSCNFVITKLLMACSIQLDGVFQRNSRDESWNSTWIAFWALLFITCANYMLTPMRDAVALAVGVQHMPALTLASTGLAVVSSVPIGWLFEAPDPKRRKLWKRMGLTRGETQGTSLALFYRFFAVSLLSYAVGFELNAGTFGNLFSQENSNSLGWILSRVVVVLSNFSSFGKFMYVAFFLVVHLMKLHSLSLIWGVTTEAMDYEESAKSRQSGGTFLFKNTQTRLKRLGFVGFGGTLGGILGSIIASTFAHVLRLSGLLVVSCVLLEISALLSIELGRIMQIHWEEEKKHVSTNDLTGLLSSSLDTSMKRSHSMDSMKRVASGNSLNKAMSRSKSMQKMAETPQQQQAMTIEEQMNDNSFGQRLLRGITTILRSRLLMAIFTYNALYASTSVLLSFQRAALVVNRSLEKSTTTTEDTAFLAKINIVSSVAVFCLQASGMGSWIAHTCGPRGTLALIPLIRLVGVFSLAWWHLVSNGQPPNLLCFLLLDECTKVINFAVAKPVRESLWRGLSNEARYEAKPIVDTLANRWGGGSAAFLVSLMDKAVVTFAASGQGQLFGLSPNMVLCIGVAIWWAAVSADLGHIRRRIDLELLKKNQ